MSIGQLESSLSRDVVLDNDGEGLDEETHHVVLNWSFESIVDR